MIASVYRVTIRCGGTALRGLGGGTLRWLGESEGRRGGFTKLPASILPSLFRSSSKIVPPLALISEVVKKFRFGASRERQRPELCKVLRSLTLPARLILRKLSEVVKASRRAARRQPAGMAGPTGG